MFFEKKKGTTLPQVAYHEAGHACYALWLGWRVGSIIVERERGDASGYHGVAHTVGWLVSDADDPNLGWSEACWRADDDRLAKLLTDDVDVLLAGWIAQTAYLAKSKGKKTRISPHELLQPCAAAIADFVKADERARLLRGWDPDGRSRFLAHRFYNASIEIERHWSDVEALAKRIISIPQVEGRRELSGKDVHAFFDCGEPDDRDLDRCPGWPPTPPG